MVRRKRDEEPVNQVFAKPRDPETPGELVAKKPPNGLAVTSNGNGGKNDSHRVVHARDMSLPVPDQGEDKLFELFLDSANVPHIKLLKAKGRQIWPVEHEMVYNHMTHFLFEASGHLLPTSTEVKGYLNVLKSVAVMNGQRTGEVDWKDNVLEQDALTNAIFTLTTRKAPKPWEATAAQILTAVDVLAAKEALDKGDQWPKAPNRLSIELERRQEVLRELGVSVTKLARVGVARKWRLEVSNGDGSGGTRLESSPPASPDSSQPNLLEDKQLNQHSPEDDAFSGELEQILGQDAPESKLSHGEILKWIPRKWSEFVGNDLAIVELKGVVKAVLDGEHGYNVLVTGPEDSGRDAMILLAARTLLCDNPDLDTLDPCGTCPSCVWEYGNDAVFDKYYGGEKFKFLSVDCPQLTTSNLAYEMDKARGFEGTLLVYLRRLDYLSKDALPDLLTFMDDKRFLGFAKASGTAGILPEILNQFEIQTTADPPASELARFLAERCRDWGIKIDSGHTLIRLAHICGQRVGDALEGLAEAADTPERRLTLSIVENSFDEV
jgi:hypothetical protein